MNKYRKEFYEVLENIVYDSSLFEEKYLNIRGHKFLVYRFINNHDLFNNCLNIANAKIGYISDMSQNSEVRKFEEKRVNLFMGIYSEMVIHVFLNKVCGFAMNDIKRWDLERESFKYTKSEYDIILNTDKAIRIESRSSRSYVTTIEDYIEKYTVIGDYINNNKTSETPSDLYIKSILQYKNIDEIKSKYLLNNRLSIIKKRETLNDIINGELELYLISSATRKEMTDDKSFISHLGQPNARYRVIKILDAGDMSTIKNKISDI